MSLNEHQTGLTPIYSQQSPRDLRLYIALDESLQPSLQVLAQQTIQAGTLDVCFQIIGESHYVLLSKQGGVVLQELFACVALMPGTIWHQAEFQALSAYQFAADGYQITVGFSQTYPSRPAQLRVDFPTTRQQVPFTEIGWQHQENWLQWWTVHSYPGQRDTIFAYTTTEVDLAGR